MSRLSHLARNAAIAAALCVLAAVCAAETTFSTNPTRFLVCDKGVGGFEGKLPDFSSRSGVKVTVRATKRAGFAVRGCEASLNWGRGETLIASQVEQADIDVMGADLGFGVPVVAFQIKATEADPTIKYEIYSLTKPARLLRTITGQDYFSAADTRLNGTVEIWTTDANGFDNLPRNVFDAAPTVVLRFEDEKLMDVSSEFRDHYDEQINTLRSELGSRELSDFKASDGRLSAEHLSPDGQASGLLATKIRVLEIVWAYLYSGREQQAWDALHEMWPASDAERIRAAITNARARGVRTQVDGVRDLTAPQSPSKRSVIYEHTLSFGLGVRADQRGGFADSGPQQILLRLPSPNNPQHWDEERQLQVVIDEAGKVRSARMADGIVKDISAGIKNEPGNEWVDLAAGWKYIPAFKDGHPTAFRSRLHVFRDR